MRSPFVRSVLALLCLCLLVGPLVVPATGQLSPDARDVRLRLYGCADDLVAGPAPAIGPDGTIDCPGDVIRLPAAWLASASSPHYRKALGPLDQRVDLALAYHPAWWAAAPGTVGHGLALADPRDPSQPLFDRGTGGAAGRLDMAFVSDEELDTELDDNDAHNRVDLSPHDGLPDRYASNDGRIPGADVYMPALGVTYTHTWYGPSDARSAVASGASFVAPGAFAFNGANRAAVWTSDGKPAAATWVSTPLGMGTASDGGGAFAAPNLMLRSGQFIDFLDYRFQLNAIDWTAQGWAANLTILSLAGPNPRPIASHVVLDVNTTGQKLATLESWGNNARNVAMETATAPSQGAAFPTTGFPPFVVLREIVVSPTSQPTGALFDVGRLVGVQAPWNLIVAEQQMHIITQLQEQNGRMRELRWTHILPLGDDFRLRASGIDVRAAASHAPLPLLPPFDSDHRALADMRVALDRDAYGFVQAPQSSDSLISASELQPRNDQQLQADRAARAGPLHISWTGQSSAHELTWAATDLDQRIARGMTVPFRYVSMNFGDTDVVLLSDLLSDARLFPRRASQEFPMAARAAIASDQGFAPIAGHGLRLYSATDAVPASADVVHLATAVVGASQQASAQQSTGAPDALRVDASASFEAYYRYAHNGGGLLPVSDEAIDRNIDANALPNIIDARAGAGGDNLFDVAPRNTNPAFADIYGPALRVDYAYKPVNADSLVPVAPSFGPAVTVPIAGASRTDGLPGLGAFDLDGDHDADNIVMAAFWDRNGEALGTNRWRTDGPFDVTSDFVLLQSPVLSLRAGGVAQLFDFGVQVMNTSAQMVELQPMSFAQSPTALRTDGPVRWSIDVRTAPTCAVIQQDGVASPSAQPCAGVLPAATNAPYERSSFSARWWVELIAAGPAEVALRMSQVVPAAAAAEESVMLVNGARYVWSPRQSGQDPLAAPLQLRAIVPLGSAVPIPDGANTIKLSGLPIAGKVPMLFPFNGPHARLDISAPKISQDVYGFETQVASDLGASLLRAAGPFAFSVHERGQEGAHRFVWADPLYSRSATGAASTLRFGGTFATPSGGLSIEDSWVSARPQRLDASVQAGFPELISDPGSRGWDHFAMLRLPLSEGPFLVDSARVGTPGQLVGPPLPGSWADRVPSVFAYRPDGADDLYVPGAGIRAPVQPVEPGPAPPVAPVEPPAPAAPPKPTTAPGWGLVIMALAALCLAGGRRRLGAV